MKKRYMSPKAEVVVVHTTSRLLAGSLPDVKNDGYDQELESLVREFDVLEGFE